MKHISLGRIHTLERFHETLQASQLYCICETNPSLCLYAETLPEFQWQNFLLPLIHCFQVFHKAYSLYSLSRSCVDVQ